MKKFDKELEPLRISLHATGIRMTHQRIEIFREICRSHGHPSVAEVYEAVRDRMPTISIDTIYRTLRMFSNLRFINPMSSRGSSVRFDANTRNHHHFVCTMCGRTIDFISSSLDDLDIPLEAQVLGTAHEAQLEIIGLCKDCSEISH